MAPQLSALRRNPGILRVATLLLSLISLIFVIVDLVIQGTDDFVAFEASVLPAISLTTFCWTTCWSISAICVLIFHGPYPPGVDIGLDFIGWGLGWGFGAVLIMNPIEIYYPAHCSYSYVSEGFCTRARALVAMEIMAGILAIVYGACHLWFFIKAIRTELAQRRDRRNKSVGSEMQDGEHLTA